jgi:hypothetical protein
VVGNINTKAIVVCADWWKETLMPKAKVIGDVKTNILTIAERVYFDGKSSMITKEIDGGTEKK